MQTRYDAVIFDLFGTLIVNPHVMLAEPMVARMAAILGIPPAKCTAFTELWNRDTWPLRATGKLADIEANIAYVLDALHLQVDDSRQAEAAQLRRAFARDNFQPREDAETTLARLKASGYRLGLISDCSSEVPALWQCSPLVELIADPIFSCVAGMKKPDPRMYQLACQRLEVAPERCLYVGDDRHEELPGARAAGMYPVLICDSPEEAGEWQGAVITRLSDIFALLG